MRFNGKESHYNPFQFQPLTIILIRLELRVTKLPLIRSLDMSNVHVLANVKALIASTRNALQLIGRAHTTVPNKLIMHSETSVWEIFIIELILKLKADF